MQLVFIVVNLIFVRAHQHSLTPPPVYHRHLQYSKLIFVAQICFSAVEGLCPGAESQPFALIFIWVYRYILNGVFRSELPAALEEGPLKVLDSEEIAKTDQRPRKQSHFTLGLSL